jgi:hypothetical protein
MLNIFQTAALQRGNVRLLERVEGTALEEMDQLVRRGYGQEGD